MLLARQAPRLPPPAHEHGYTVAKERQKGKKKPHCCLKGATRFHWCKNIKTQYANCFCDLGKLLRSDRRKNEYKNRKIFKNSPQMTHTQKMGELLAFILGCLIRRNVIADRILGPSAGTQSKV